MRPHEVMESPQTGDVTALLVSWADGDRTALDRLMPLVYGELRRLAHRELRREGPDATLATTALVHEAYLRLVDQKRMRVETRAHFLNVAAQMMRRVVIDAARKRRTAKRGSGTPRMSLDDVPEPSIDPSNPNLLDLDAALTKLESFDPRLSRIVELRYFAGLTLEETAEALGTSTTAAWRDWNTARAWLYGELQPQ
jgi:RNA polymerase sigma factor (TIGR02999 family)